QDCSTEERQAPPKSFARTIGDGEEAKDGDNNTEANGKEVDSSAKNTREVETAPTSNTPGSIVSSRPFLERMPPNGRPRSRAKAQISRDEVASAEMVPHTVMINKITVIPVAPAIEPNES
ncbi:MAG: hypothetical protein LQ341_006428, partial [Variospora aurantia]